MNGKSSYAYLRAIAIAAICARGAVTAQHLRKSLTTIQKHQVDAPRKLDVSAEYELVNTEKKAVNEGRTQVDVIDTVLGAPINVDEISRIVGGNISDPGEFPYFVGLGGCAGTLIAPTVVLTAAHCNPENRVGNYAFVGASKKKDIDNGDFKAAESIRIKDAVSHPKFKNKDPEIFLNNDFGLLLLEKPYIIESDIKLVLNGQDNVPETGEMLDAIGMGTIEYGDNALSQELRDVAVPAITNDDCEALIGYSISKKQLCAGQLNGGKDACQGDSGGPLILRQDDVHIQVGITSWGRNCGKYPGVYSRISTVYDWIEEIVCRTWQADSPDLCKRVQEECQDDEKFSFENSEKECEWVAKKAAKRCNKKIEGTDKKFKHVCKKTCRAC